MEEIADDAKFFDDVDLLKQLNFPKAELHCHMDGTFRLSTIIEMAKKKGNSLPTYNPDDLRKFCAVKRQKNLPEYLACFPLFTSVFAGCEESIARITREAIEDKAKIGVRYLELRYSPHLLANCNVTPLVYCKEKGNVRPRDVVRVVCEAVAQAQKDFNIHVRIILCCIVAFPDWSNEVAELCKEFSDRGVVAIDIAGSGDEEGVEVLDHQDAFRECIKNGIRSTVHAGELGCASEVQRAMDILHAERIGHGYHVVKDEGIYTEAKEKNIHFEVCPLSSYLTASVDPDLTLHPAVRFMKDKANFSLSTDDDGVQQSSIYADYIIAIKKFGFSIQQLKDLNLNALRSAFCEESLKKKLIEEFEECYKK